MTVLIVIGWLLIFVLALVVILLWVKTRPDDSWKRWLVWKWGWEYRKLIATMVLTLVAVILLYSFWPFGVEETVTRAGAGAEPGRSFFQQLVKFPWGWRTFLLGLVLLLLGSVGGVLGRILFGLGTFALAGTLFFPLFREVKKRPIAPRVEEFTVNAQEEKPTVLNGPGTIHRVQANKTWIAIAADPSGKVIEYPMPAGDSRWGGVEPEDLLWVRGVEEGTTLRFERIRPK